MSQTLVGLGYAVNFGFSATSTDHGLTATNLTGYLLQNAGYSGKADLESVRQLQGDVASENYYDYRVEATLTMVIGAAGIAAAITATTLASFKPGTIISITACASHPDLVATNWIVTESGPDITGDVTKSAEIKIPLRKRAGITAAQAS